MGKYLITGRPGAGKTTVIQEAQRRGLQAFNTDGMPEVTRLEEQDTGNVVPWPSGPIDWSKYIWNWQDEGIMKLLALDGDVFIGAIIGNQQKYYPFFDEVFALTLSAEALSKRLETHAHERTAEEKASALALHNENQQRFEQQGLILIPAEPSPEQIVDNILAYIRS